MSELENKIIEEKKRRKITMNHLFENRFRELKAYLENISKKEQNNNYLKKVIKKSKRRYKKALDNMIKGKIRRK